MPTQDQKAAEVEAAAKAKAAEIDRTVAAEAEAARTKAGDRTMSAAEAAEFEEYRRSKLTASDAELERLAAETKANEDAGYDLLPVMGSLHRQLVAAGHTLPEVIAKAAKNAFGLDLTID